MDVIAWLVDTTIAQCRMRELRSSRGPQLNRSVKLLGRFGRWRDGAKLKCLWFYFDFLGKIEMD